MLRWISRWLFRWVKFLIIIFYNYTDLFKIDDDILNYLCVEKIVMIYFWKDLQTFLEIQKIFMIDSLLFCKKYIQYCFENCTKIAKSNLSSCTIEVNSLKWCSVISHNHLLLYLSINTFIYNINFVFHTQDINDNVPVFTQEGYHFVIYEDADVWTEVGRWSLLKFQI